MKYLFITVLTIASCTGKKSESDQYEGYQTDPVSQAPMKMRTIKAADLKTGPGYSTPVISSAQKFILPVPAFGQKGEPLIYPPKHPKAGQPILDYQGNPIGERGIVFFNHKDQSWQAAAGDGQGVIIINEVTQEQAEKLHQKVNELQSNPDKSSLDQLKQVLAFARKELNLKDTYNSTRSFVKEKMTPVLTHKAARTNGDVFGLKKRDDRDVNQAIYIPGEFVFEGPAVSPQKFKNGGVIIEQSDKMRGVQPEIFMRTYTLADGSPVKSVGKDIKSQLVN